jgi:hypothetical protein
MEEHGDKDEAGGSRLTEESEYVGQEAARLSETTNPEETGRDDWRAAGVAFPECCKHEDNKTNH